jgi:hypothetical protein
MHVPEHTAALQMRSAVDDHEGGSSARTSPEVELAAPETMYRCASFEFFFVNTYSAVLLSTEARASCAERPGPLANLVISALFFLSVIPFLKKTYSSSQQTSEVPALDAWGLNCDRFCQKVLAADSCLSSLPQHRCRTVDTRIKQLITSVTSVIFVCEDHSMASLAIGLQEQLAIALLLSVLLVQAAALPWPYNNVPSVESMGFDICKIYCKAAFPFAANNFCKGTGFTTPGLLNSRCDMLAFAEHTFQSFSSPNATCPAYKQTRASTVSLNGKSSWHPLR